MLTRGKRDPIQTDRFSQSDFRSRAAKGSRYNTPRTKQEANKKSSTSKPGIDRCEDVESNCSEEIIGISDDSSSTSKTSDNSDDESNYNQEIN